MKGEGGRIQGLGFSVQFSVFSGERVETCEKRGRWRVKGERWRVEGCGYAVDSREI